MFRSLLVSLVLVVSAAGQTAVGPFSTPQANTDYYVGTVPGFYPSIQAAVTATCALGTLGARVIIPAGSPANGVSGFTISVVTGGCVKVGLEDLRPLPSLQYMWSGSIYTAISPGGGVTPVTAGTVQSSNLAANNLFSSSTYQSSVFNTANNGVATLQALSGACLGTGCDIFIDPTDTTTENYIAAVNQPGTHVQDRRQGAIVDYFYNSGGNLSGTRQAVANSPTCFYNQQPQFLFGQFTFCNVITDTYNEPGFLVGGEPTNHSALVILTAQYGRGITQAQSDQQNAYKYGDDGLFYMYQHIRSGEIDGGAEAAQLTSEEQVEDGAPSGTSTGKTVNANGTVTVHGSWSSNFGTLGDVSNIIDTPSVISTGFITSIGTHTSVSGFVSNMATTSDTHSQSSSVGFLPGGCGIDTVRNAPIATTCTITLETGFATAFVAGKVCIGDPAQPEQVTLTSPSGVVSGSQTATLGLTYQHQANVPVYQGGSCGGKTALGNGFSDPTMQETFTSYFVAGSRTTTSFDYVYIYKQTQQGNVALTINSPSDIIVSGSSDGSTVTLSMNEPAPEFNTPFMPSLANICISGSSNSAFNICGITATTVTNSSTVTFASTIAAGSTAGGTLTITGLNNYVNYCGASTTNIPGSSIGAPNGTGDVQIEPSDCPFTSGDVIWQPNFYSQGFSVARFSSDAFTPPALDANVVVKIEALGAAWSGGSEICGGCEGHDAANAYVGYGGTFLGHVFLQTINTYSTFMNILNAPIDGGILFHVGVVPAGGPTGTYSFYEMESANGLATLDFDTYGSNGLTSTVITSGVGSTVTHTGVDWNYFVNPANPTTVDYNNNTGVTMSSVFGIHLSALNCCQTSALDIGANIVSIKTSVNVDSFQVNDFTQGVSADTIDIMSFAGFGIHLDGSDTAAGHNPGFVGIGYAPGSPVPYNLAVNGTFGFSGSTQGVTAFQGTVGQKLLTANGAFTNGHLLVVGSDGGAADGGSVPTPILPTGGAGTYYWTGTAWGPAVSGFTGTCPFPATAGTAVDHGIITGCS